MSALELQGVSKHYGAIHVSRGVSLSVRHGETVGILGPNGAGKTTLFNLISGDVAADRGTVVFDGADVTSRPAHERARLGIGRSYQIPRPFGSMTVFENCLTAARFGAGLGAGPAQARAVDALRMSGMLGLANQPAGTLTLLNRKRLELARALSTSPTLLLLDEIAGGLTEAEAALLVSELQVLKQSGITIVWIEHVLHALMKVADRLVVLNFGEIVCDGKPDAVMADPKVRQIYLGTEEHGT
ncbi:ABC transporter ATP-binding protein [Cupriavidus oxalaticus]|uniref:ABC transporter ATP-binding protein n=1 Tax=Cupriavidus oxalaticus TaxID=96344 RepID=A0A375FR99_9BURK|nr:ABC transporter ATP-binding protein [Cupriavidus oxalaticus]QRQ85863.1 ABC transporter ATP-binding protein [Cupriavidus oxalaticus]QRQ95811.1 ABC transporter ATP-binding protein [Cupriavidus oxalaticus]WQD84484.1 ABC transporter ATP-binding protein [Cupriavidus oxalaticus]SPC06604.1 putative branched-chain amino acid ABC transporter, ATP-binding protein [Cupriavidus oxalaticus]SPC12416.1 putative branched-chain amino acid ABC transporter, ATP-binding protein [Cupriavidus oxalaticus]